MSAIFMNSKNSTTSDPLRQLFYARIKNEW